MSKSSLTHLQKVVQEVSASKNSQEKIAALTKAFELFVRETGRLETAYSALKEQFEMVNLELEKANTNLKNKVNELDFTTQYLNSILSNISQGILFIDLKGNITIYNAAAEQILKVDQQSVLFKDFWANFQDDIFGFSMREALSVRKSPHTTFATLELPGSGQTLELETDTTFVVKERDANHDLESNETTQGMIVLIRNITDIRRLQHLANRHDRMKELGEMAAMVAHEIRNPLGGIKGFASLLWRDLKEHPQMQQMAGYIIEGTDHLNQLVTNVLSYSRPVQIHLEATDLVSLMIDLQHHLEVDENVSKNIHINNRSTSPIIMHSLDPLLMKSSILNLIVNAIQAMPQGGTIDIALDQTQHETIVKVSDTGTGIPEENLEKIFSPFFTTKAEGNGFGLSEVHKVIQAHGGTIDVISKAGKGTTFTITLPLRTLR
jgi:signal transduction histidine kinase